jgi:hypothetical protein
MFVLFLIFVRVFFIKCRILCDFLEKWHFSEIPGFGLFCGFCRIFVNFVNFCENFHNF